MNRPPADFLFFFFFFVFFFLFPNVNALDVVLGIPQGYIAMPRVLPGHHHPYYSAEAAAASAAASAAVAAGEHPFHGRSPPGGWPDRARPVSGVLRRFPSDMRLCEYQVGIGLTGAGGD